MTRGDFRAFLTSRAFWGACIVAALLAADPMTSLISSGLGSSRRVLFMGNFIPSMGVLLWGVLNGVLRVIDYRAAERAKTGFCVECGYDLTGNVSGVCPECGAEVKQP